MLESLAEDLASVVEQNDARSDCFIEIEREGCRIMQIGDLRVTCAWPPFSEAWEITVVRPVAHLKLSDYELNDELIRRLSDHHRGVFVVGKPGSGKTTFAQAIAAHLDESVGAMVKTMEAPRDLQVPQRVTQYAPLEGNLEKTAEVIFLVRPDFVIFDEVRRARFRDIWRRTPRRCRTARRNARKQCTGSHSTPRWKGRIRTYFTSSGYCNQHREGEGKRSSRTEDGRSCTYWNGLQISVAR